MPELNDDVANTSITRLEARAMLDLAVQWLIVTVDISVKAMVLAAIAMRWVLLNYDRAVGLYRPNHDRGRQ